MKLLTAWLTFVVFLASANAQVKLPGRCPNVTVQEDLDLDMFMGSWYLQSSYHIVHGNHNDHGNHNNQGNHSIHFCSVTYSKLKNNTLIFIRNQVHNNTLKKVSIPVEYLCDGKFELQISGNKTHVISRVYSILATDYKNYTIRYSCRNMNDEHEIFIGIGTRKPNPSDEVMKAARDKISEKKLPLEHLTVTRSKACDIELKANNGP